MERADMRQTIITCDLCGEGPALELAFDVGTCTDAAGSVDRDVQRLDLCDFHMMDAAKQALDKTTVPERSAIFESFKKRKLKGPV